MLPATCNATILKVASKDTSGHFDTGQRRQNMPIPNSWLQNTSRDALMIAAIVTSAIIGIFAPAHAESASSPSEPQRHAKELQEKGQVELALSTLEHALSAMASDPAQERNAIRLEIVSLLSSTARKHEIARICQAIIEDHAADGATNRQLGMALLWKGRLLMEAGQLEDAGTVLERAVDAVDGTDPDVTHDIEYELGQVYEKQAHGKKDAGPLQDEALTYYISALRLLDSEKIDDGPRRLKAVERVAFLMRQLYSKEQAIGWLRMAIKDPANLTDSDLRIAKLLGSYLDSVKRFAWYNYLLHPTEVPDPTTDECVFEFGEPAAGPSSPKPGQVSACLRLQGEEYRDQGMFPDAIATLTKAAEAAESPIQRLRARLALIEVFRRIAYGTLPTSLHGASVDLRHHQLPKEFTETLNKGLAIAQEDSPLWMRIAAEGSLVQSLETIHAAVEGFWRVNRYGEGVKAARTLLTLPRVREHPQKHVVARQMLVLSLAKQGRHSQAVELAMKMDQEFSKSIDIGVLGSWAYTLIHVSPSCALTQCPDRGWEFLRKVEDRYPTWRPADDTAFPLEIRTARTSLKRFSENWPQWRGPYLNGTAQATRLPVSWSLTENIRWNTALPSWGAATPIIWEDRVFVVSPSKAERDEKAPSAKRFGGTRLKPEGRDLFLICLSRKDGTQTWQRLLDSRNSHIGKQNMASPSPVTDGSRVYALTGTGVLAAFDMAGNDVWRCDIQEQYGEFGLNWGYASSPLLFDDKLIVQVLHGMETDDPSYVVAFDPETGSVLWRVERPTDAKNEAPDAFTTPIPLFLTDRCEFVVSGGDYITGHNPKTGSELWRMGGLNPTQNPYYRIVSSPLVVGEKIVASAMRHITLCVKAGGQGDISKSHLLWKSKIAPDVPTPASDGKHLYVLHDDGRMSCLNLDTGETYYEKQRLPRGKYSASPLLADGKIYVINETGQTTVLAAGPEFQVLSTNDLDDTYTLSSIAASGNELFIRTSTHLYCICKR